MKGDKVVLVRHSPPTMYDHAPRGSWCRIDVNDHEHELFVQRSSEEFKPVWERLGIFSNVHCSRDRGKSSSNSALASAKVDQS